MISKLKTGISNRLLYLLFYPAWLRFRHKSPRLEKIQFKYLKNLVKKNIYTQFGADHNFNKITSIHDFQKLVPITNYEYYTKYIERIKRGEKNILSTERVKKFSLSSGTETASKLIPNTQALLKEFDICISAWIFDLYRNVPRLLNGRAFWIISPSTKTPGSDSSIKNGFDNDSEYFSPVKQWLIRNLFSVPDEVAQFCQGENYYFVLGVFLLADKNLRLISIWNPSVMLILLDKIVLYQDEIIKSIETGSLLVPESMESRYLEILRKKFHQNPKRADELRTLFALKPPYSGFWKAVWPDLAVISAWDSAWAKTPAKQVKELFPNVTFQGKGLLATEACITFPVFDKNLSCNYFPAYTSHFFEFEDLERNEIKLLHQLQAKCMYEVIVTTGGGLYRYRLNDIVSCYGNERGLPLLHFEGKSNLISDITGEKLHEKHVEKLLHHVFHDLGIKSTFYFLAPEITEKKIFYVLFIQSTSKFSIAELQKSLEAGLCENFHYKHCRVLDQLGELEIFCLNDDSISKFYSIIQENKNLGSSKQTVLRKETTWKSKLD